MSNQELAIAEEATEEIVEPVLESLPPEVPTEPIETGTESEPPPDPEVTTEVSPAPESEAPAEAATSNIYELKVGQRLNGIVKNIAPFGAFVDVGIPQDGLVHISKLAKHKVDKVADVVSEGQEVEVWVKKVDTKRGRLSLTMVKPVLRRLRDIDENDELEGTVTRLEAYGAFVDIDSDRDGLVHISQITHDYIKHPEEALKVGDSVTVKVLNVNRKKRQVDLSIKALLPEPVKEIVIEEKFKAPQEQRPRKPQRPRSAKPKKEKLVIEDGEPMMTAMAVAYAAMRHNQDDDDQNETTDQPTNKAKKSKDIDDIIARTLANHDK